MYGKKTFRQLSYLVIFEQPDYANNDAEFNELLEDANHRLQNGFDDSSEVTSLATSSSFSRDLNRSSDWYIRKNFVHNQKFILLFCLIFCSRKKPSRKCFKSQVLRCVKLRGVSAQILSADVTF